MTTTPASLLTAAVVAACIGSDRSPTVQELDRLAERIWIETGAERSAFGWGRLQPSLDDRVMALRAALVSMTGSGKVRPDG
ncbi:hypothetical protein EAH84_07165 [Sphingomonas oligophenolica]|uniref:Uncharacterized protein n=1 Tax=Sphingomonas oligophenolica TaxID=301154 RepID=A0A502CKA9_9SPHN|nr:hypothetical protein EAH84_07165 [Sphingomonas oligophenolica]